MKEALNLLAGEAFAAAFSRSTDQNDYRWGKLHRITFSHMFGGLAPQFSIPAAGDFVDLAPTLPGLAVDGGFETFDVGGFDVRAASSNSYTFRDGAARRYVGELRRSGLKSVQVIPGGESGVAGRRFHTNQLRSWLTNRYHPVLSTTGEINSEWSSTIVYKPAH